MYVIGTVKRLSPVCQLPIQLEFVMPTTSVGSENLTVILNATAVGKVTLLPIDGR